MENYFGENFTDEKDEIYYDKYDDNKYENYTQDGKSYLKRGSLGLLFRVRVWTYFWSSYWSTSLYPVLSLVKRERESKDLEISIFDIIGYAHP